MAEIRQNGRAQVPFRQCLQTSERRAHSVLNASRRSQLTLRFGNIFVRSNGFADTLQERAREYANLKPLETFFSFELITMHYDLKGVIMSGTDIITGGVWNPCDHARVHGIFEPVTHF